MVYGGMGMKSKLMGQIVSAIGVFCSIISLLTFTETPIWVKIIIVVVAIICLLVLLVLGIKSNMKNNIICDSEDKIKAEMKKMLQEQGKIVVMSRSLGWVDDEILVATGRKKDRLIVYAEKENDITKKLKDQGVIVRLYGRTGFIPKTRYTIIRYGRNDAQVNVAKTQSRIRLHRFKHIIHQTSSTEECDDYVVSLAIDMVNLMEKVCDRP